MGIFDKIKSALLDSKKQQTNSDSNASAFPAISIEEQEARYKETHINMFREELSKLIPIEIQLTDEPHNRNKEIEFCDVNSRSITKSTNLAKLLDFVSIDVETTGIKTGGNDIIEVSAIHFHNFKQTELFTTLIRPRKPIPRDASDINGITDEMVQNAPKFCEIIPALTAFIGKMPVVAHNAAFDLKHLFVNGLDAANNRKVVYDTLHLSKKFCDEDIMDHKLSTVCRDFGIVIDGAHRATADALACGMIFVKMLINSRDDCYDISDLIKQAGECDCCGSQGG